MIADKIREYLKQWKIPALDNDILKEMVHDIAEIFADEIYSLAKEKNDEIEKLQLDNEDLKESLDNAIDIRDYIAEKKADIEKRYDLLDQDWVRLKKEYLELKDKLNKNRIVGILADFDKRYKPMSAGITPYNFYTIAKEITGGENDK